MTKYENVKAQFLRWLMPNGGTLVIMLLLLMTQSLWAKPFRRLANVPGLGATTVNYQGRLLDSQGNPLNGAYEVQFALYDAETGGTLVWGPETYEALPVDDGLFNVGLGTLTEGGIPTTVWDGDRYLEIAVNGETLAPRELIRSVPIAGVALTVPDGAIETSHIAKGAVTSGKQTITTYHTTDGAYVSHQGKTEKVVSAFTFDDVPAGDVTVIVTLMARTIEGATPYGSINLDSVSPDDRLDQVPTHILPTTYHGTQIVLHGHLKGFTGGTLKLNITIKGEEDASEFAFGVANGDGRFGRHITVIAGQ